MSGAIKINGTSSGSTTITAPASGGDETIELSTALAAKLDASAYAPGMVHLSTTSFSSVSSVNINSVFTTTYNSFRVVVHMTTAGSSAAAYLRLRASGTDSSTGYATQYQDMYGATNDIGRNSTTGFLLWTGNAKPVALTTDIVGPASAAYTGYIGHSVAYSNAGSLEAFQRQGFHEVSTAYDGLSLVLGAAGSGSISIYGYAKA